MELTMIDVGEELKRMAKEFGIPEKEVATNWRNAVRSAWGDSIFKKHIYDTRSYLVTNTNPRSMKRYPKVRKVRCAICGDEFGKADTELDHIDSEVKMTEVSQANDFIRTIFFTSPDKLQIVCKDKKKKINKKNVLVSFGCHGIKTYSERYGVSFEEALLAKHIIHICKDDKLTLDKLKCLGVRPSDIPNTKVGKKKLLTELMSITEDRYVHTVKE